MICYKMYIVYIVVCVVYIVCVQPAKRYFVKYIKKRRKQLFIIYFSREMISNIACISFIVSELLRGIQLFVIITFAIKAFIIINIIVRS